jgi:hypothetical protein
MSATISAKKIQSCICCICGVLRRLTPLPSHYKAFRVITSYAKASIVMAKWEGALDEARMHRVLDERALERDLGSIAPAGP